MRLGDLDALEAVIRENIRRYYSMENEVRSGYCTAQDAADEVKYAPTIDAVPVVHGHWYDVNLYEHGEKAVATCSQCRIRGAIRTKRTEYGFWVLNSPMCPNCGARMDGEG